MLVQDQGKFLRALHSGQTVEDAIDTAISEPESGRVPERKVRVELPEQLRACFPPTSQSGESTFYDLKVKTRNPLGLAIPTITLQSRAGQFISSRLFVHVAEGSLLVDLVEKSMAKKPSDFVEAARGVALEVQKQCYSSLMKLEEDQRILLVRGLTPAREQVAKKAGYRQELLVVLDMTLAELSINHGIVVLQAIRKKPENLEMVVQQLALACFYYQLLTNEL
jgi:hypothetical protein